jgi:RNA polymerase sigma factor (sigma-70 family)
MNSSTTLAALVAHCRKLTRRQHTPDAELLHRFVEQRETAAFEELVERYAPLVWSVCRRILPREADCEDAFQAAFLCLVRQAGSIDPNRPLGAWLHTIAVRTAAKARSRLRRQPTQATVPEQTTCGDIADELGNRELFRVVDEEIARLPPLLREPFVLCCLEGRTRDEAAAALGCSIAAVKSRLERSRNLLRRRLERRGIGLPAAFLVLGLTGGHVSASLRAKALHCVFASAPSGVAALVPAASVSLTRKLTLTALSLVVVGTLGLGSFCVLETESPNEVPAQAKDGAPKSPQPHAAEKSAPRLDRYGDPLPPGAIRRFGTLRFRLQGISELAFTPDGKQLIAGDGTGLLVVFDAVTGRKLRTVGKLTPNHLGFGVFTLSPDGKRIACCGSDVFVWDLESGQLIRALGCGDCQSLAFSPDGKKIAVVPVFRAKVVIVEVATGKRLGEWTIKKGWVNDWNIGQYDLRSLAFSPDEKYLVGVLNEWSEEKGNYSRDKLVSSQVCVLDAAKGAVVRTIGSKESVQLTNLPFHYQVLQPSNGQLATWDQDGILRFWDAATGKMVRRFAVAKRGDGKALQLKALRLSTDGRCCAVIIEDQRDYSERLLVLDAKTGWELRRFELHPTIGPVAVALSSDGSVVASGMVYNESCVRVWDVESGKERLADVNAGHRTSVILSLSANGGTLISDPMDGGRVIHWDLRSGNAEIRPPDKRAQVGDRVFTRGSEGRGWSMLGRHWRLTYKSQLEELEVRCLDSPKLLGKVKVPPERWGAVALSSDGSYLAYAFHEAGDPNRRWQVLVWDPEREKEPHQFSGNDLGASCEHLCFSHGGKRLIAGIAPSKGNHSETIWIWDTGEAKVVRKLSTLTYPGEMILSADDRYLITNDMGRVWNLETGKEQIRLEKKGEISFLFPSLDKRFLVSAASGDLNVWETSSWKPIRSFASPPSPRSMLLSGDGRSLFVANRDSTILEWDVSGQFGKKTEVPNPDRLNVLWRTLAQTPDKAYTAVWQLLDHPAESVPFLIGKLAPVLPVDEKRVRQLLSRLDSESFADREQASRQLLALGEQTLPLLRQALTDGPSLEARKRIEGVIESLNHLPTPDQLRLLRALAVLEWSNRPEAVEHLQRLAGGAPSASLTRAAKSASQRRNARAAP